MPWTILGSLTFSTSKQASSGTPRAYSMVPMAPSPRSGCLATRSRKGALISLRNRSLSPLGGEGRVRGSGSHTKRPEHLRRDLVGVEARRVHTQISLGVEGFAGLVERLDLLACLAVEHRPIAASERPLAECREIARQPNDRAQGLESFHAPVLARQPATRGNDIAPLEGEKPHRLILESPEVRLALRGEDLGDGAPLLGGDHVVGLEEAAPEPLGQDAPDRRLARSHETHKDHIVIHVTGHRIIGSRRYPYRCTVAAAGARR